MRSQGGAAAAMVLVILVLISVVLAALWLLRRVGDTSAERDQTTSALENASAALEAYVAGSMRLPCPADPAIDDGGEALAPSGDCDKPAGTVPWRTIGLSRERALDAWGRKISYRVYRGGAGGVGSLIQTRGASMVNCDSNEALPTGVDAATGLCKPVDPLDTNPASRSTSTGQFLAGKGLKVQYFGRDLSPDNEHVAYVLISHGATGLGGYTSSGVQLDNPTSSEERANLNALSTTTYYAMAFSGPEVSVKDNSHFDDVLLYRTIADLAKRANLAARNWPDDVTGASVFDKAAVEAGVGGRVSGTDTQRTSIQFNSVTVSAFTGTNTAQDISLKSTGPGEDGIGGASGDASLSSKADGPDEFLRLDFVETSRRFALSMQDFGYEETSGPMPTPTWIEQVQIRFFRVDGNIVTPVDSVIKQACAAGNALASFSDLEPSGDFNRVEIVPRESTVSSSTTIATTLFLSEVRTCKAGVTCQTTLETANPSSHCS